MSERPARLVDLPGRIRYVDAVVLQQETREAVQAGDLPDTVILLEHEPVVTLGRRTEESELHLPRDVVVDVVETSRGGRSTYHGPGQLVCYPILDLNRHGRDLRRYVRDLEAAIIRTLETFGLTGHRVDGLTGVWILGDREGRSSRRSSRKIASIGVHASRWVTMHGYALNVDLDTAPFTEWITACGLDDARFTTMAAELGRPLAVDDVRQAAAAGIAEVFELTYDPASGGHVGRTRQLLAAGR